MAIRCSLRTAAGGMATPAICAVQVSALRFSSVARLIVNCPVLVSSGQNSRTAAPLLCAPLCSLPALGSRVMPLSALVLRVA